MINTVKHDNLYDIFIRRCDLDNKAGQFILFSIGNKLFGEIASTKLF